MDLSEWVSSGAVTPFAPLHAYDLVYPKGHALGPFQLTITALTTSPLVVSDISNFDVRPELSLSLPAAPNQPDNVHRLSAVIYFGAWHFTCRYRIAQAYLGPRWPDLQVSVENFFCILSVLVLILRIV